MTQNLPTQVDNKKEMTLLERGHGFSVMPRTFQEVEMVAEKLSKSPIIPKSYQNNPASCFTAILMGLNHGIDPVTSLQTIDVISSIPSIRVNMMRALVMRSGVCESIETMPLEKDGKYIGHSCTVIRKGQPPHTSRFTLAMAAQADLTNKDNWKKFPAWMCENRAIGRALKDVFADILFGLHIVEEVQDYQSSQNDGYLENVNPIDPEKKLIDILNKEETKDQSIDIEILPEDQTETDFELESDILSTNPTEE